MLTSKGMAGVPGSSFLALSATVAAIGHGAIPVAAVALLLGADRIMDSMRVSVNLLGNCVATFVVARWEGQLDKDRMRRVLRGDVVEELDEYEDAPSPWCRRARASTVDQADGARAPVPLRWSADYSDGTKGTTAW